MRTRFGPRRLVLVLALWAAIVVLLWITWRSLDWSTLVESLARLTLAELGILLLINAGIFVLMSVRWWWILQALGFPISILTLARYRLTAFGINYFTPGPQFGGEPYQVYMLHKRKGVPLDVSTSSVALDKLIELLANFGFLLFGFFTIVRIGYLGAAQGFLFFALASLVVLLIGLYLFSLFRKKYWARWLIRRMGGFSETSPFWRKVFQTVTAAEKQTAEAMRTHPGLFVISLGLSVITWVALVYEYRLALVYLGSDLPLAQTVGVLTAARIAFLFPFPGGLGSLEFSQVFAMQALGAGAALGISMGLLIRSRDILFGGVGLLLAGAPRHWRSKSLTRPKSPAVPLERIGPQNSSEAVR